VYTSDNISDEKQGARLGYEHSGSEGGSETESNYLESIQKDLYKLKLDDDDEG
jgi:hypothetical protein